MAPKHCADTIVPVLPRVRYSIPFETYLRAAAAALPLATSRWYETEGHDLVRRDLEADHVVLERAALVFERLLE